MKEKIKAWSRSLKSENGAVMIVEAAFVFPVMFFVLFFLIYFGNMYVVKSAISRYTSTCAIKGAEYYSNPWVKSVTEAGGDVVPTENKDVQPYRYIFPKHTIENEIQDELQKKIEGYGGGFFNNMKPENLSCDVTYTNYILYSTFTAETKYTLTFPLIFIGEKEAMSIDFSSYETVTITDGSEFVRNTDMAIDYMQQSEAIQTAKEKINGAFEKVKNIVKKFAGKS